MDTEGSVPGIKRPRREATITGLRRLPDPSESKNVVLGPVLKRTSSNLAGSRSDHHLYVESRLRMHGMISPGARCLQGCLLGQLYKVWQLNKWADELSTLVLDASSVLHFCELTAPVAPAAPVLLSSLKSAAFLKVAFLLIIKSYFFLRLSAVLLHVSAVCLKHTSTRRKSEQCLGNFEVETRSSGKN
jgi:hypothetical protein